MNLDTRAIWFLGASLLVLGWDVFVAGRIATARGQRPGVVEVSGLCGLLIVPGAIIAVASSWANLGRTVALLGWIWPLTLLLFVAQGVVAAWQRRVSSFVVVPFLLLNLLVLVGATARLAATGWPDAPPELLGVAVALTGVIGVAWGPQALGTPLAIFLPLVVPVGPSRWPGGGTVRAMLALAAAVVVCATAIAWPASVRSVASFRALASATLVERPRGDMVLGIRIFPVLDRAPIPLAIRRDLPLVDTIGARVLSIIVTPAGATPLALDSLAGVLADVRSDSVLIAVSLGYDPRERERIRVDPVAAATRRVALTEQIVRRVRPNVLIPALDPMREGRAALGPLPLRWWTDYIGDAARMAHRVRPATRVAVPASSFTPADSQLYAWALASREVDLAGFSFAPGFNGGGDVRAQLRVASRWMAGHAKPHWVTTARGYPTVFGEAAQRDWLVGVMAWATRHPLINAVVVDGAGDYDVLTGLRRPDGRLRPATFALAAANRALREAAVALR